MESSGRSTQTEFHHESNGVTSHTVNSKRFCLLPKNVNMSVFSADNRLIEQYNNSYSTFIFNFIYRINPNRYSKLSFHKFLISFVLSCIGLC